MARNRDYELPWGRRSFAFFPSLSTFILGIAGLFFLLGETPSQRQSNAHSGEQKQNDYSCIRAKSSKKTMTYQNL